MSFALTPPTPFMQGGRPILRRHSMVVAGPTNWSNPWTTGSPRSSSSACGKRSLDCSLSPTSQTAEASPAARLRSQGTTGVSGGGRSRGTDFGTGPPRPVNAPAITPTQSTHFWASQYYANPHLGIGKPSPYPSPCEPASPSPRQRQLSPGSGGSDAMWVVTPRPSSPWLKTPGGTSPCVFCVTSPGVITTPKLNRLSDGTKAPCVRCRSRY
mmetsp:Transcript_20218/g.47250  ORF Transcript_20218/g.47250 Transcript_20218/m.47250 type:complete len:212 (-) Transcript_20218:11-646(-)